MLLGLWTLNSMPFGINKPACYPLGKSGVGRGVQDFFQFILNTGCSLHHVKRSCLFFPAWDIFSPMKFQIKEKKGISYKLIKYTSSLISVIIKKGELIQPNLFKYLESL